MRLGPADDRAILDAIERDPRDDGDDEADDPPALDPTRWSTPRPLSTRQALACVHAEPSWWEKPDADYTREATRMSLDPKAAKIPAANRILGMDWLR